jgi:hypothetical protein
MAMQFKMCVADGSGGKKHPCPDCDFCQGCPDSRCDVCLREQRSRSAKRKRGSAGKKPTKRIAE